MINADERRKLAETPVTLNGERAKITGISQQFATVRQIQSGLGCEFAWETVRHIVSKGGAFQS